MFWNIFVPFSVCSFFLKSNSKSFYVIFEHIFCIMTAHFIKKNIKFKLYTKFIGTHPKLKKYVHLFYMIFD